MQKTVSREKLQHVTKAVPLEVGAIVSYLRANGVKDEKIGEVRTLWNESLDRRERLYEQIERAYGVKNDLMRKIVADDRDPGSLEELTKSIRRIVALNGEVEFEEQQLWVSIAKRSGLAEVAGGLRWTQPITARKALQHPPVEGEAAESNKRLMARMAEILKQLRKERGMTLEQVAKVSVSLYPMMKEAHITAPHLHRAENAKTFLSPLKLMALSQVYGLPFDIFLARLDLKNFADSLKDLARCLVLGVFKDVVSSLHDRRIGMAEHLARLRHSLSTSTNYLKEVSLERDSLKRQVKFLEDEVKALREGGKHRSRTVLDPATHRSRQ